MTKSEIQRLREIASKATQGHWSKAVWVGGLDLGKNYLEACCVPHGPIQNYQEQNLQAFADAEHIAAFNPSTVLKLLADLEVMIEFAEWCEVHSGHGHLATCYREMATEALSKIRGDA